MNILILGADITIGGIGGYVSNIISHLDEKEIIFHMAVSNRGNEQLSPSYSKAILHLQPITYSLSQLPKRVKDVRNLIIREHIDVVHLNAARAGLLGSLATIGLPVGVVYTGHSWRFEQKPNIFARKAFSFFERYICWRADYVTFISKRDKDIGEAKRLLNLTKAIKINTRIAAGEFINVEYSALKELRRSYRIPEDSNIIGNVGRIEARKDPFTFIRAANEIRKNVPNCYFIWVGDGELKSQTIALANSLGIRERLIITGFQPKSQIPVFLHAMNVFFFTSLFEGVPLSLLEAMAAKRPIVCSAYPGIGELIEHDKTGFIYPAGDFNKAAQEVISILRNSAQLREITNRAYSYFMELHSDPCIMANQYAEVYRVTWKIVQSRQNVKTRH